MQQRADRVAIADLAVIGDQHTAALVTREGTIAWYCPGRFDEPSVFASLLDPAAGDCTLEAGDSRPLGRRYVDASTVLETRFDGAGGPWSVTDWMTQRTLCRHFTATATGFVCRLRPRPGYASRTPAPHARADGGVAIDASLVVHASQPARIVGDTIRVSFPAQEPGWIVVAPQGTPPPGWDGVDRSFHDTVRRWQGLAQAEPYSGPYERAVHDSLRAIRLLRHAPSGGIVAAATTSLPEVPGGDRNWDYRYVWLRDTGMIASALTRLGGRCDEARAYLDFVCSSRGSSSRYPIAVLTTLDGRAAPRESVLPFAGYLDSRPVRIGNDARNQLQLDAFGNVVLAAKLLYERTDERLHWHTVAAVADFIADHWLEEDHGIWEESPRRHYTAGKVIAACALDSAASFTTDANQARRWRGQAQAIRTFVRERCLTRRGAFAVFAGSEAVDVSAALFPVWNYVAADAPEMTKTIAALESEHSIDGVLFRRHLVDADARREGAFLAGTLWVAQYWVKRGDVERAGRIIDAVLACGSDLGQLAEEADLAGARMLGNFPQAFVHAALVGAVIDLKGATHG